MVSHLAFVGNLHPLACTKQLLKCLIVCPQTDRFLWFRDNLFLDSCLQHPWRLLIDSWYDWEPAGRRAIANGLLLLHCWWQKLCHSRLPVQLHIVSGRPLPLKDLFFGIVRRWIAELSRDIVVLLEILFFISGPAVCPMALSCLWPNLQEKRRCWRFLDVNTSLRQSSSISLKKKTLLILGTCSVTKTACL